MHVSIGRLVILAVMGGLVGYDDYYNVERLKRVLSYLGEVGYLVTSISGGESLIVCLELIALCKILAIRYGF